MTIGRAVKLLRTRVGLKQSELASAAGFSVSHLSLIESDKRRPTIETLNAISSALKVPTSMIMLLATPDESFESMPEPLRRKMREATLALIQGLEKDER